MPARAAPSRLRVPDLTIESIAGHVSRKMLEHYSHIRLAAKRKALDALDERREQERQAPQPKDEAERVQ